MIAKKKKKKMMASFRMIMAMLITGSLMIV